MGLHSAFCPPERKRWQPEDWAPSKEEGGKESGTGESVLYVGTWRGASWVGRSHRAAPAGSRRETRS